MKLAGATYLLCLDYKALASRNLISFAPTSGRSPCRVFGTGLLYCGQGIARHAQPADMDVTAEGGAWKTVHAHSSAPLDFEASKLILQR